MEYYGRFSRNDILALTILSIEFQFALTEATEYARKRKTYRPVPLKSNRKEKSHKEGG
jgi:hypothetical protein